MLFLSENPFLFENNHSLLHDFKDDDYLLHSIIPSRNSLIWRPRHHLHHYHFSPYKKLEKKLKKVFDCDTFKLVDFSPKINISEDDKNYYVHADLPGMTKDQVKMEISEDDHTFTISGERKSIIREGDTKNEKPKVDNKDKEEGNQKVNETNNKTEENESNKKNEKTKKVEKDKKVNENKKEISKKEEKEEKISNNNKNMNYSLMECSYGKFKRTFTLPENIDTSSIHAKMENGVLNVIFKKVVPDHSKNQTRTIEIQ